MDEMKGVHIVPGSLLLKVWGALLLLTAATVAITWVDLGTLNLFAAMAIATVKATLVALYFMHLRWDKGVNAVVFITAIVFVMIFVSLALMDTLESRPDMIPDYAPDVGK